MFFSPTEVWSEKRFSVVIDEQLAGHAVTSLVLTLASPSLSDGDSAQEPRTLWLVFFHNFLRIRHMVSCPTHYLQAIALPCSALHSGAKVGLQRLVPSLRRRFRVFGCI